MHVADLHALFVHVFGEVFGHLLGEGGDERAIPLGGGGLAFGNHVIDLRGVVRGDRAHLDRRIDQAGGADDLFGEDAAGLFQLPRAGGGGDVDGLRAHLLPFLEFEGAVVLAAGQAETVFGQGVFAGIVALVHGAQLGNGLVAFIHENKGVVG